MEVINPLPNPCHGTGEMPNSEQAQPIISHGAAVSQVLLGVCVSISGRAGAILRKALIEKMVWTPCSDSFVIPPQSVVENTENSVVFLI